MTDGWAVAHGLGEVEPAPSVVTIGNFDGVHRGHQVLLRRAVGAAREHGARAVAVTFDPHPAAVLRPGSEPPALQTVDARADAVLATGIDLVVVLPFTRELSRRSPQEFVEQVLVAPLRARRVIVGTNFRFGHRATGDVVVLVEEGDWHGFSVEAVTVLELDGVAISSSSIRDHLLEGRLEWANRALGRPHRVVGEVVAGEGRGRTIGVPTANVAVEDRLLVPANGVYAGHARLPDREWACVINVGVRPTFEGQGRTVEVHLLDASVELYGQRLEVLFEHRLRDERRFDGVEALVSQIRHDIEAARGLLRG